MPVSEYWNRTKIENRRWKSKAYFLLRGWLQSFAYPAGIDPLLFLAGGAAALNLAWITISFQAVKAASANPARSLRYE